MEGKIIMILMSTNLFWVIMAMIYQSKIKKLVKKCYTEVTKIPINSRNLEASVQMHQSKFEDMVNEIFESNADLFRNHSQYNALSKMHFKRKFASRAFVITILFVFLIGIVSFSMHVYKS